VLYPAQCDQIIALALSKGMNESEVRINENNSKFRQSSTCWIGKNEDPTVSMIYSMLERLVGIPQRYYEKMQVVHYLPGQFFLAHYDQCNSSHEYCRTELQNFQYHPRVMTCLIYLSDPSEYDGGETRFPNMGVQYKAEKGMGVLFHNLNDSWTRVHPLALHEGAPVTRGEKWIANIWIRAPISYRDHVVSS
jgi:prolyl 4-hydroxylase